MLTHGRFIKSRFLNKRKMFALRDEDWHRVCALYIPCVLGQKVLCQPSKQKLQVAEARCESQSRSVKYLSINIPKQIRNIWIPDFKFSNVIREFNFFATYKCLRLRDFFKAIDFEYLSQKIGKLLIYGKWSEIEQGFTISTIVFSFFIMAKHETYFCSLLLSTSIYPAINLVLRHLS